VISIRRISLGGGFATHRFGRKRRRDNGTVVLARGLLRESGTPPGVFLGSGLADLDGGKGLEAARK